MGLEGFRVFSQPPEKRGCGATCGEAAHDEIFVKETAFLGTYTRKS